jgi:hypothetical protein
LSNSQFAEVLGKNIGTRLAGDEEIPHVKRFGCAPPLARFVAMAVLNPATEGNEKSRLSGFEKGSEKVCRQDLNPMTSRVIKEFENGE